MVRQHYFKHPTSFPGGSLVSPRGPQACLPWPAGMLTVPWGQLVVARSSCPRDHNAAWRPVRADRLQPIPDPVTPAAPAPGAALPLSR